MDDISAPYSKSCLEDKYVGLFDALMDGVTSTQKRGDPLIRKYFYDFVRAVPLEPNTFHDQLLRIAKIKPKSWEKTSENGVPNHSKDFPAQLCAEKAFCLSAQAQKVDINLRLIGFVKYIDERYRADVWCKSSFYAEHKKLISEIILSRGSSDSKAKVYRKSVGDPALEREYISQALAGDVVGYVGDAITVADTKNLALCAVLAKPYNHLMDDFEGKFSLESDRSTFSRWIEGYGLNSNRDGDDNVRSFIEKRIEAASTKDGTEAAKVGFVSYNHGSMALGRVPLVIRPLNHLMTLSFNRDIAQGRIDGTEKSPEHVLWSQCLSHAFKPAQVVEMPCPSQMFIEVAIVTIDEKFPITHKSSVTSVYAKRNHGKMVKTCGFEFGPNWKDVVVEEKEKNFVSLNILRGIHKGLEKEFDLARLPDWAAMKEKVVVHMSGLVVQALHLNSAILGFCKIPYTSQQLLDHLRGKEIGGLDHKHIAFVDVGEAKHYVEKYGHSTEWHGTAMMRLALVDKHFSK
jgi:hypothetical protein